MSGVDRECVTHHHACDCREAKFAAMQEALEAADRLHKAVDLSAGDLPPFIWEQLKEPWRVFGVTRVLKPKKGERRRNAGRRGADG